MVIFNKKITQDPIILGPEILKGEDVISFFHGYLISGLTRKATLYLTNYRVRKKKIFLGK